MIVDTIRYDTNTIQYIYVRSKADEMASLIYRTAQQRKIREKLKTKTEQRQSTLCILMLTSNLTDSNNINIILAVI